MYNSESTQQNPAVSGSLCTVIGASTLSSLTGIIATGALLFQDRNKEALIAAGATVISMAIGLAALCKAAKNERQHRQGLEDTRSNGQPQRGVNMTA